MTKYAGKDFLLQKEVTYGGGTYQTVGGFKTNNFTINNESVDVTDKGDVPWRQLQEVGIKSMSASGQGVWKDDAYLQACLADMIASGTAIRRFKIVSGRGDYFIGLFKITSLERSGEYNGIEQFNISLESAGAVTYTAA